MEPDTKETDFPPLPGAAPLRKFILASGLTLPDWCEKKKLDRFTVQKILNGQLQRCSVEVAFRIEDATDGEVLAKLFVPRRTVRDAQQERRHAAAKERARAMRDRRSNGSAHVSR
jgi:hypothetical protein